MNKPDRILPSYSIAILRLREKNKLNQRELAEKIGVLHHHISEMEHGKRAIGKNLAKRIGAAFKCDYRLFL